MPLNPFPGVVGDFNGDGNLDVAVFPDPVAQSSEMQIIYGDGNGTLTPSYVSYPLGKFWVPQFAADVNGDGLADLVELPAGELRDSGDLLFSLRGCCHRRTIR